MNFKYFDYSIYHDSTRHIERFLESSTANFHVFLHHDDWNDQNKELLFKILTAIKVNIEEEVQIFGLKPKENAHIAEQLNLQSDHRFLAFGLNANRIGLQIKTIPYDIITIKNVKVLFSHKLSDLQKNVNYKKKLWGLLQKFNFNKP